jgi:hypothetical protein
MAQTEKSKARILFVPVRTEMVISGVEWTMPPRHDLYYPLPELTDD